MVDAGTSSDLMTPRALELSLSPPLLPNICTEGGKYEYQRRNHPHVSSLLPLDVQCTRAIGKFLGRHNLNALRDSGSFRFIVDWLVTLSCPSVAFVKPSAAFNFLQLSSSDHLKKYKYGSHFMQEIHLYERLSATKCTGFVFFVHGGAWGSGMPWMYRLVAGGFLQAGMSVAIVGYRTYPCADVNAQVHDLESAATFLAANRPDLFENSHGEKRRNCCLIGHSSGAHIALLMLVERVRKYMSFTSLTSFRREARFTTVDFDSFVGLSGPYSIDRHFHFEARRGVEELSPMKAACGHSSEEFFHNSPAFRLKKILTEFDEDEKHCICKFVPRMLLVHGIEDTTVPFTATSLAANILTHCGVAQCDEAYISKTGHQDTIMHFMLGGKTQETVMAWLVQMKQPA
eukprot:CAMPEP_0196810082 /NCGR_PEP_ID=MMETSP1362-20130617/9917_1 /TAXON_ID=163516 /ORGANISM="Leptocylindrus danicus, Strain CCMP1856" /LENGTH=400 /DNA_ID=CAMNT_0042184945 /DNA_START=122 /DNA_END=1320 /DNA_ORIENTATION=+